MYRRRRPRAKNSKISWLALRSPSTLPDTMYLKLPFHQTISMGDVVGVAFDIATYSINSLFQPNAITPGSRQPLGFDEWSAFYNVYQVLGSSIKIQILSQGTTQIREFILYPSNSSAGIVDPSTAREQPYAKHKYIVNSTTTQVAYIKHYIGVKKLEARSTNSINFAANVGSNPSEQKFWHFLISTVDGSDLAETFIDVKIMYYAKMSRRKDLAAS